MKLEHEQENRALLTETVMCKHPAPVAGGFSWSITLGTFALSILLAWMVLWLTAPREETPANITSTQHPPTFHQAQSVYAILRSPTKEILDQLAEAHKNGAKVRLITSQPITAEYQINTVSPDQILNQGYLINGTTWYTQY